MKMEKFVIISVALALVGYTSGAVLSDSQKNLKCLPNRKFTYDHNFCQCNDAGTTIFCERKLYSLLAPLLHQDQLQQITQDCTPGEIVKQQCQECVCDKSGKYANCVRTGCSDEAAGTRDQCVAGTVFADDCNACICGTDGKGVCTNLNCPVVSSAFPNVTTCAPDSHSIFKCNDCNCAGTGKGLFCDRMGCSNMDFDHENLLNVTTTCTPDTKFDYNCHQCQCDEKGNYAMCSGKPCPNADDFVEVVDTVDKCNPGIIFANDCNVCICHKDGKGTCTSLNCDISYRFKYV